MQTTLVFFGSETDSYNGILRGGVAFLSLILFDFIWFSLTKKTIYTPVIQNVTQRSDNPLRIGGGLFAWLLLASALAVQMPKTIQEAAVYGALVGLVVYGVFNTTNYTIFQDWSLGVVAIDTVWGIFNCCMASVLLYFLFHQSST